MARTTQTSPITQTTMQAPRRRRGNLFQTTFTLAFWRLRQTWRLLLLSGLGTIAAVMLVCAVPLFSAVAMSAGLRGAVARDPLAGQLVIQGNGSISTADQLQRVRQRLDQLVQKDLGSYATQAPVFSIAFDNLNITPTTGGQTQPLRIVGVNDDEMTAHATLVSGQWPAANAAALEIALTASESQALQAPVGTIISIGLPQNGAPNSTPLPPIQLRVVGIYAKTQANDPLFIPSNFGPDNSGEVMALASNQALLTALASFNQIANSQGGGGPQFYPGSPPINWYYPLDISNLTINNFDDLSQRLENFESDLYNNLSGESGFQIQGEPSSLLNILDGYRNEILVTQIPIVTLLLQVFGLILLFISLMVNLLVERQGEAIAVLRSRGAPRGLIFRSMTVQTICICLLALIVGPALAFLLVGAIAARALGSQQNGALAAVMGNPLAAAWGLRWYALVAVLCAFVAMLFSTYRAANQNILALRRDVARSARRPLWQRLNLDIIFAIVALLGYALYTIAVNRVPPQIRIYLSPLALIAPIFLLLAFALLFLRFFPALLRLGARIALRNRNAAPMLAISQMARAPRQASRMALLLALATAFALFTLIFSASQYQRTLDVAAFAVGADFSGQLGGTHNSLADLRSRYQQIPGVISTTPLYSADLTSNGNNGGGTVQITSNGGPGGIQIDLAVHILAVDASTYGQTAIWPDQSVDPVSLANQLNGQRSQAISNDVVPAVIDQALAVTLHVSGPGDHFAIPPNGYQPGDGAMRFVVVAIVQNIPTLYDDANAQYYGGGGGLLVDYQTFAAVYQHDTLGAVAAPAPNTVWLRTQDDNASLASVRAALTSGPLALDSVLDRRAIITATQSNPLVIDLFGTLDIGAGTALALALLGVLIASWLSARTRLTSFALLRAIGTEPKQLTGVLLWEQGIVYTLAIVLGMAVGLMLSILVLPVLVIANSIIGTENFDATRINIPPVHTAYPLPLLALALGILVVICLVSIVLMTSVASRASIGQALRLNED